uniref:Dopa decarboxylase protein remnant n=1 Tax=Klebsiella pneumoniae TaxID=573 RepID=A0A220QRB3_KLEPN|nr:hypothetical protein TP_044 [Klebsiella pneumoniae]
MKVLSRGQVQQVPAQSQNRGPGNSTAKVLKGRKTDKGESWMSTQNVNVKPSTKESTTLRTDGFVRNIHSRNPFDVIRADVVLERIEKEAGWCCGMHYELYQAHLLGGALDYLDALPLKDRPVLMGAAAKRGYLLTLAEEERALEARDVLMSELAANDC